MDFKYHYTPAQERFREEVIAWLDANLDPALDPASCRCPSAEDWPALEEFRQSLGRQGWLHPRTDPGHTGTTPDEGSVRGQDVVLAEELERRGLGWLRDRASESLDHALGTWAAPALAEKFAGPLLRGDTIVWHTPLEPEAPPLACDIDLWAEEDGDDYLLNGEGRFAGIGPKPGLLWTLARLGHRSHDYNQDSQPPGPPSPDSQSLICCLVPGSSKGLVYPAASQSGVQGTRPVAFENVRVPRYCLLGEPGAGPQLMASAFSKSAFDPAPHSKDAESEEAHRSLLDAALANSDPDRQQTAVQAVMDSYIDSRVARLFRLREACLQGQEGRLTYHRAQTRLWERRAEKRIAEAISHAAGPYALLDRHDPRAPDGGRPWLQPRFSPAWESSPGHWLNDRDIIARWLGMSPSLVAPK